MNHKAKRKVDKQLQQQRRAERYRQELAQKKKKEFLKKSIIQRLRFFYSHLPTRKAKIVFWLWSPVIFGLFLPVQTLIALLKMDIAWKWTGQILYSFLNGK